MTFTGQFLAFWTYTAMVMAVYCKADRYPPPTGLSYEWLDKFTVTMSWKRPSVLPEDEEIEFLMKNTDNDPGTCVSGTNFTQMFLTEEMCSARWTYKIWTVSKSCKRPTESNPATITIDTPKPRAEVVKDFLCVVYAHEMNCSWIPANRSLNLTLSYRTCGYSEESVRGLKKCDQPYSSGERNGCNLHIDTSLDDFCILVETEAGMSTFKPVLVVPPPVLSVREEGDYLQLSMMPQEVGNSECWIYTVCYSQCNEFRGCYNTSRGETTMKVLYNKSCRYEFQSNVTTAKDCIRIFSNLSEAVPYGSNVLPDGKLTVVAIVIPVILSICVILSCYCFRRHVSIICPIIPDPSAIFKEMMMNGNKELKTTAGSLYTPVPELIEPCKITLVTENSVLKQNS
ncbi:interleukin-13 receptor subunit alpha-1-like [Chelmon rostratus]|uniref:interleukin-13 receptor subunit alpha-1-like n=1 Tax=Chelmon rostratus TaxID=109905 RepID=UPI001BE604B3|nr:interleukin-13 receptor subunit alpha-1-like [Chelmon rostratus]